MFLQHKAAGCVITLVKVRAHTHTHTHTLRHGWKWTNRLGPTIASDKLPLVVKPGSLGVTQGNSVPGATQIPEAGQGTRRGTAYVTIILV